MFVRFGTMRALANLQTKDTTRDAAGGETDTYTTVDQIYVSIEPLKSREIVEASASASRLTHRIWTRYDSRITHKARINYEGRNFNITEIRNKHDKNAVMELMCEEVA